MPLKDTCETLVKLEPVMTTAVPVLPMVGEKEVTVAGVYTVKVTSLPVPPT